MTKNLIDNGIKPYATIDLEFRRNYLKYETAGGYGGQIGTSANYVEPVLQVGLGGFTLLNNNGFRFSADLDYRLTLRLYNNEYSYREGGIGNYKTSTISGLNTVAGLTENSYLANRIVPSFSGQWSGGNVAFRFKLDLPIVITNEEANAMAVNAEDKLVNDGSSTTTSTFDFIPNLALAMQWRIVPSLALNAGGQIGISSLRVAEAEGKNYTLGQADDSFKRVTNTYGATATRLTVGVTYNPTDFLQIEANTGVSNTANTNNEVSVFDTVDGLFNFGSILVSLKF